MQLLFMSMTLILALTPFLPPTGTTYDLSKDFSFKHNPNGAWQYGYSATNSLDPADFRLDKYADPTGSIGFWHPDISSGPGPGWYPYIAFNETSRTQYGSMKGWSARPGEIAMEASISGQYSLVRFIAPKDGAYQISATFEGVHFGLSTTDVHVLHNGASLFDADIDGYGGDPAFHRVEGADPTASYSGQVELKTHDIITFAVGYGKDKTNSCDTTGMFASVVRLPGGGH